VTQPRSATVRAALEAALRGPPRSAKELSAAVGIPERAVGPHLEHLARSVAARGERLELLPPRCVACGFVLVSDRAKRPSRCPACRSERLEPPRFRLAEP